MHKCAIINPMPRQDKNHDPTSVTTSPEVKSYVKEVLEYPGDRPSGSYITYGDEVVDLPNGFTEFMLAADEMLRNRGLPGMDERIPVLAYGANAAPDRLRKKMAKFGQELQDELQVVPHCSAVVKDTIAGWHGRPSQAGGAFAELIHDETTRGVDLRAHVAFLTQEQLAVISTTEGATYSLADVDALLGDEEHSRRVLSYVALESSILRIDDKPVPIGGLHHRGLELRGLVSASTSEAVEHMLRVAGIKTSPADYIQEGRDLNLSGKKSRQSGVGDALSEEGARLDYVYPEASSVGRAAFAAIYQFTGTKEVSGKTTIYTIPEQELERIRPTKQELFERMGMFRSKNPDLSDKQLGIRAGNSIDPARIISRRAHDELAARLRQAESSGHKIE